jgi:hypothetical protein
MDSDEATRFMTELLAIWTEADRASRRASIESHYHSDIRFTDLDGEFVGYDALETFSDSLQARFPGEQFELVGRPDTLGDAVRAYWDFGPASGMDFALSKMGRSECSTPSFSRQTQIASNQSARTLAHGREQRLASTAVVSSLYGD